MSSSSSVAHSTSFSVPLCGCNKPMKMFTSKSDENPGRRYWKCINWTLGENMSESCGSNGFPNAEGNKQKPSKKRTRLEVEEDPTEALSTTQDYLTTCQQPFKYLTVELKLVKDLVQEHVMPQVKNGERSWLCRSMWYNLSDLYNHEAKKAQFANQVRGVDDILDMAKRVNWCDCPNDTEGKCSCAVVKIPHFNSSATSGSTSSRKRSYDDAFSSLGQQVAQQVNFLVSHGHLTREMADDASVLYSRLIDNGLIIVVQRFCNMDDIKEKVALIEWHMVKFKDYM